MSVSSLPFLHGALAAVLPKLAAWRRDYGGRGRKGEGAVGRGGFLGAQGHGGRLEHLSGGKRAAAVVGVRPRGGFGVHGGQAGVQALLAARFVRQGVELGAPSG